jgi:hypothetical protein
LFVSFLKVWCAAAISIRQQIERSGNTEWGVRVVKTPIRRLEGISYWVIEDADGIYDFVNNELRKEWEEDVRSEHRDLAKDEWLSNLSNRKWSLKICKIARVKLSPTIVNYVDKETGYVFKRNLARRRKQLQREVQNFGAVIWPLIVRAEDLQLVDGYCRYAVLKTMNVSHVYAYIGFI